MPTYNIQTLKNQSREVDLNDKREYKLTSLNYCQKNIKELIIAPSLAEAPETMPRMPK